MREVPGREGLGGREPGEAGEGWREEVGPEHDGGAWKVRTWTTWRLACPSLLGPRGALVKMHVWTGERHGGLVQAWADLRGRFPRAHGRVCGCLGGCAHTQKLAHALRLHTRVAFAAPARPPRPRGHVLTPWQTRCPSPPRARQQASQEATGNSDPARAPQTWSGDSRQNPWQGGGAQWPMGRWGPHPTSPGSALPMPLP